MSILPFDDLALGSLALVAATTLIAGFLRGFVGFGAALVNVPVLSQVAGPVDAICISSLIGIPAVVQLLPTAFRECEPSVVGPMCAAILLATPAGVWILVSVNPAMMKVVISVLVLAMVALVARGWRLETNVGLGLLVSAGVAGGLVQGVAGIGGPPVVAVALSREGTPARQRGNVLALMTAISMSSLLPLSWLGLFTPEVVIVSAMLLPFYAAATWIGAKSFSTGSQHLYRSAALATLGLVGLSTLALSLHGLVES